MYCKASQAIAQTCRGNPGAQGVRPPCWGFPGSSAPDLQDCCQGPTLSAHLLSAGDIMVVLLFSLYLTHRFIPSGHSVTPTGRLDFSTRVKRFPSGRLSTGASFTGLMLISKRCRRLPFRNTGSSFFLLEKTENMKKSWLTSDPLWTYITRPCHRSSILKVRSASSAPIVIVLPSPCPRMPSWSGVRSNRSWPWTGCPSIRNINWDGWMPNFRKSRFT